MRGLDAQALAMHSENNVIHVEFRPVALSLEHANRSDPAPGGGAADRWAGDAFSAAPCRGDGNWRQEHRNRKCCPLLTDKRAFGKASAGRLDCGGPSYCSCTLEGWSSGPP